MSTQVKQENISNLDSQMIKLSGKRGEFEGYVVRPKGNDPRPAVIVIHEIFGLTDDIKEIANRYARQGYIVFAPNLFSTPDLATILTPANIGETMKFMRTLPPGKTRDREFVQQELQKYSEDKRDIIGQMMAKMFGGNMPRDKMTEDLLKIIDYLDSRSDIKHGKIASIGYCFGGGMSINLACHAGKKLSACVVLYGQNPTPIDKVKNIECPVLGIYAGEDLGINMTLHDLLNNMAQNKKDFELKLYPGCFHGFFNNTRKETYNADAAKDVWERVLRLFQRTIGTELALK